MTHSFALKLYLIFQSTPLEGTVSYFCRSRGHGYIRGDESGEEHFVHVSDIESEFVPMKEDKVSYGKISAIT